MRKGIKKEAFGISPLIQDKVSGMVFFRTTTRYLSFSFSDSR